MTKPDGTIYQLQKTFSHEPDLMEIEIRTPGDVILRLCWISDSQMPREAEIRLERVTRLEAVVKPTGNYQVLGLSEARRTATGVYEVKFSLGGKDAISVEFGRARTKITMAPELSSEELEHNNAMQMDAHSSHH